jgi:cystathionine gamma-synthase
MSHFATRAVHAGLEADPSYGSVIPPIHQTSTYAQRAPGEFVEDFDYARSANPTRRALERALGELEGGLGSAFGSGMAATHALLTAATDAGAHIVLPGDLYGGTYRLVDKVLSRFGLEYDLVDQTDPDAVGAAVRPETRVIWVETPTNPLLNVVDIGAIIERKGDALVAVDNTFATPAIQRPLAVGAVPGPFDCFLVHRGLRTLHLRVAAHTENARAVSHFLREQADVGDVRWPGFGGMVSFRHPAAARIAAATKVFTLAESLGGVESLIEVPQAMTHQSVEDSAAAVPPDLVRLSCGVEAAEDLVEDLRQALA